MQAKISKDFAKRIFDMLKKEYPKVKPALVYSNPFELLISTILSAQCTDERVNIVTKELFKNYKKPQDFINLNQKDLEKEIYSTGFYKQKAKNIIACCKKTLWPSVLKF
jgi:endonuclease-3